MSHSDDAMFTVAICPHDVETRKKTTRVFTEQRRPSYMDMQDHTETTSGPLTMPLAHDPDWDSQGFRPILSMVIGVACSK
jgi:hypothetical protein